MAAKDGQSPDLPELQEGLLWSSEVQAFFSDLAARAEVIGIVTKGGEMIRAEAGPITLEQAQASLASRTVHGVQVRYLFEGREWCDTLLWVGEQVRLIRLDVSHLAGPGGAPSPGV